MPLLKVQGVEIDFPFRPYPAQLALMSRMIKAVSAGSHALLESPTGSGKSAALLCASLAWHAQHRAQQQRLHQAALLHHATTHAAGSGADDAAAGADAHTDAQFEMRMAEADEQPMVYDAFASNSAHSAGAAAPAASNPFATSAAASSTAAAASQVSASPPAAVPAAPKAPKPTKIYFASRTHSQLTQLVGELKATRYRPTMSILGSRHQYCIHPQVSESENKNEDCKKLLDFGECRMHRQVHRLVSTPALQSGGRHQVWDIEELVAMGRRAHACPYFAARQLAEQSSTDIVFAPYNYLLDPVVCRSMGIDLEGSVVIIDEAHNIEDVSRSAASREMTLQDMRAAEAELTRVRDTFQDDSDRIPHFVAVRSLVSALILWIHDNIPNVASAPAPSSANSSRFSAPDAEQYTLTGDECVSALDRVGVTASNLKSILKSINNCCMKPTDSDKLEPHLTGPAAAALENLAAVFEFLFSANMKFVSGYRMVLRRERNSNAAAGSRSRPSSEVTYVLCFWCLNPAVAFARLASAARSIILTSGTLSPMDSFASELGVPFGVRLEAPHVIDRSQILAHVVSAGPTGQRINCTFKHTDDPSFQDELGAIVLAICQRTPAGVLVFFPSYALLDKVAARWRETKLWIDLLRHKCVLMEPKGSGSKFDAVMDKYLAANQPKTGAANGDKGAKGATGSKRTKKTAAPLDDDCLNVDGAMDDEAGDEESSQSQRSERRRDSFKASSRFSASQTGGLFLAVSRGKISEGIDFADYAARAVIIVGVPFPAAMDSKVLLKKAHNDAVRRALGGANGAGDQIISGSQWYALQAYRSTNQALGRAIRHRYDYGAVFLVDERYSDAKVQQSLSKWVQPSLATGSATAPFAAIMDRTTDFFAKWTAQPPAPPATTVATPSVGDGAPLSGSASGGMRPMSHFFGQSAPTAAPTTQQQQQQQIGATDLSDTAADADPFPGLDSDDDEVQFIPLPPLPASKPAAITRPRIQIAYQNDATDAPPSAGCILSSGAETGMANGAAAAASSSSKPRASARDLIASATGVSSSAVPIGAASSHPPPPPSAPTHLALSCRKCHNALAALPIVQRVAAPPYHQQLTASYFVGTVTSALQQLQQDATPAAAADALPVLDHVSALVCSSFALEPTAEGSFGWLGYPCAIPPDLPARHFDASSQFFNIWVEADQICYQPLCCVQCRSFVGAQILVDRRDASPSFEEVCWVARQLVDVSPVAMPQVGEGAEGQPMQQVEGAPGAHAVKSEHEARPRSASLSPPPAAAIPSSPPPLEGRVGIESRASDRNVKSTLAPAVSLPPLPAPRSGDKRRSASATSRVDDTHAASSPALALDPTVVAPARASSSRSPPPKKHKQVSAAAVIAAAAASASSSGSSGRGRSGPSGRRAPSSLSFAAASGSRRECIEVDSDDDFLATPPTHTPSKSPRTTSRATTAAAAPAVARSPGWTTKHPPRIHKKHAQKSFV